MDPCTNELTGEGTVGEFEYPNLPIGQYLEDLIKANLAKYGDCTFLTDVSTGKTVLYTELLFQMQQVASWLRKNGFRTEDTVLIVASNHVELAVMLFGVWRAGGSVACLTLNLLPREIEQRAKEVQPKLVLTDEHRAGTVVEGLRDVESVEKVLVIGKADGCEAFHVLLQDDGADCPDYSETEVDPNNMSWLMFSSGTTGEPKGIVHTHRTICGVIKNYTFLERTNSGGKLLFINLMVNSGGMGLVLLSIVVHGQLYCLSELSDDNLLRAIDRVKPNVVVAFPSQIAWLCRHEHLEDYDVSSVSVIVTGGSCINPTYERQIFDRFPNLNMLHIAYGLSETSLAVCNMPRATELKNWSREKAIERHVVGSAGKLLPYCSLKVIDVDSGEKLPAGQVGEICIRTPYLMKEYLNRPKETAESIRDGWFHTGDKGYYDADGNIFIIGRYKELIKYRMAHVAPSNIEKQLLTHPGVEDVGVVGLPHDVDGELPVAFVVLRSGWNVTSHELIQHANERLMDEERLRGGVRFIDKIPRNELGKVIRPQLTKLLLASWPGRNLVSP